MLGLFKATKAVRQVRVLIVDDDTSVRETIQDRLRRQGWDITTASNGREALAAAAENKPDIMLLDIHMPCMDGFAALECLRRDPGISDVAVMMVTGSNHASDITRAASCHVVDYVTKPFNTAELLARVQQALQQARR